MTRYTNVGFKRSYMEAGFDQPEPDTVDPPAETSEAPKTEKEIAITDNTDIETLLAQLAIGELTSVEVTTAYYKRAIVAQQVVHLFLLGRTLVHVC